MNGSTSLYNAIYVSLNELKKERARSAEEIRRQAIVVLSDGDDTSSLVEYDVVLEMAKRSETAIYAIGLRQAEIGRPKFREAEFVLRQLSQETGGRVFFPTSVAELPKIYEQISEELASQYSIAYSSKNPMRNGAWRRVDVRINRPGLSARARRGYYGPASSDRRRRMHLLPLLLYAAAAAAYIVHFAWRDPRVGRLATATLGSGILAHTFLIGMQTVHAGHAPLVGTSAAISAFVWLLGLSYLYIELTSDERSMGAFVAVLLVALDVIPALDPTVSPRPPVLQNPLFTIHVMSMLFAYASFALACALGITYVLLFKEIKAKQLGFFYTRLPSLQSLDVMNGRAITVGWVFLTIGVAIGGIWATQVQSSPDPRAQAMSVADPKILVALVSWGVYSFALFARKVIGWSGRRAAYLSALAFVLVLLNFVPVGYFLTKSHNF